MMRDKGSTHVLEAIILSLLMLAAAQTVMSLRDAGHEEQRPQANLERLARDTLTVLDGQRLVNGTVLSRGIVEAAHCAAEPDASAACQGRRAADLSLRLDTMLPAGAGYGLVVHNGATPRSLYRSALPAGEVQSADVVHVPVWNHTFATPELSCYEAGMDVNLTLVPARGGRPARVDAASAWIGGTEAVGEDAGEGIWNVSLEAATRPAASDVLANATGGDGEHLGLTSYADCDLTGLGPAIVDALRQAAPAATPFAVPIGGSTVLSADLGPLAGVAGATLTGAEFVVYEPLPPLEDVADAWLVAERVDITGTGEVESTWNVPHDAFYGQRPVVLEATLDVGGQTVVAHAVTTLDVALHAGHVPVQPTYRVALEVWMPEWT